MNVRDEMLGSASRCTLAERRECKRTSLGSQAGILAVESMTRKEKGLSFFLSRNALLRVDAVSSDAVWYWLSLDR